MTDPLETARARLAQGEIDPDEFDRIARRLDRRSSTNPFVRLGLRGIVLRLAVGSVVLGLVAVAVISTGAAAVPQFSGLLLIVIVGVPVLGVVFVLWTYLLGD